VGGETDDPEVEIISDSDDDEEQWGPDEKRRRFILECMANSDIEGYILLQNMQMVFDWLKDGTIARRKVKPKASVAQLKPIE
jgi:hypothetical protein